MKHIFTIGLVLALTMGMPVFAHEHTAIEHTEANDMTDIVRMEELVALLKQLVILIGALHIQQSYAPTPSAMPTTEHANVTEMEEHHEEHDHEPEAGETATQTGEVEVAHLVIEIEKHHDDTHVHVRYADKPEEMFFVGAETTDEDGIVADIVEHTGLGAEDVRAALTYME